MTHAPGAHVDPREAELTEKLVELFQRTLDELALIRPVLSLRVEYAEGAEPTDAYFPEVMLEFAPQPGVGRWADLSSFEDALADGPLDELSAAIAERAELARDRGHQGRFMARLAKRLADELHLRAATTSGFTTRVREFD